MALAIGVILGAGPLQNSIGTTLSSQVESLRKSRDEARTEADAANNALSENEKQLDSAGTQLVGGTLKDRRVAIVALPGVEESELKAAEDKVSKAGATVTATVTLADAYALSIHKSQGSEYPHVALALDEHAERLLSRELLYTGITRSKGRLDIYASADALKNAAATPTRRHTGLTWHLDHPHKAQTNH